VANVELVIDLFYDLLLLSAVVREIFFLQDGRRFEFFLACEFVIFVHLSKVTLNLGLMEAF